MTDDIYSDIRPYYDDEVPGVIAKLSRDSELCEVIARYKFPRLWWMAKPIIGLVLRRRLANVTTVADVQGYVANYMEHMLKTTTDGLSVSGIEKLDKSTAYLFIGNHRDIALDPAVTNISLHRNGMNTVRIAIGDNLLTKNFVSDLMRINKSFLVRRSITGKALFRALKTLSGYIKHSLETGHSIWIAQREGRAKDGLDATDPTIIKMFDMARAKGDDFSEFIDSLNMVPLSIAYEWDPCDVMKARELAAVAKGDRYQKIEGEDISSIAQGIAGYKGRIHLNFGDVLRGSFDGVDQVAKVVDDSIIGNYHLFHSNWLAYRELHGHGADELFAGEKISPKTLAEFERRKAACSPQLLPFWLAQYANPVVARLAHEVARDSAA
jgi:1-acyl-sn-glycerol-3-phosphate acyltransferase